MRQNIRILLKRKEKKCYKLTSIQQNSKKEEKQIMVYKICANNDSR